MASDASVRAFKCPTCGAPLEPPQGALTVKCGYCGGSIIVPKSLRTPPPASPTPHYMWGGVDLTEMVGGAMRLPEVISMAESGRLDEAAQLYSQITGLSHDDALTSVQSMAKGQAVALVPGTSSASFQPMQTSFSQSTFTPTSSTPFYGQTFDSASAPRVSTGSGCSKAIVGIVIAVVLIGICVAVAGFLVFLNPNSVGGLISNPLTGSNPILSLGFANKAMSFGSEGIGQGMLEDARSIGVDGNGNIVVGDYSDGRIQIFDPNGKFVSMFSLGPKTYLQAMTVSHDGKIYTVYNSSIFIYDESGQQVGQIKSDDNHDYNDATLGPDGTLYALSNDENIVRFKKDGTIDLEIPNSISSITGDTDIDTHLAVDGLGNMYILGNFTYKVFEYSPQGKFINQFGGEDKGAGTDPSKFQGPMTLTVDGYGRIFVVDIFEVKAFDSTGKYLASISENDGAVFGAVFDGNNNLYTVSKAKVVKFTVQKPGSN